MATQRLTSGQMDMADVARLPSFPEIPRNISNAENFSEDHMDPLEQWAKLGGFSAAAGGHGQGRS